MTTSDYQPPPFDSASTFSPQQVAELESAKRAMKPIRRTIAAANMDGWSLAVFAILSLICGFSSPTGLLIGAGLGIVAYIELSSIPKLKQLDPAVPRRLAYNQVALATILVIYALWNLLSPPIVGDVMQNLSPEMKQAVGDTSSINRQVEALFSQGVHLVYFTLIAVAVLGQGSLALFYFRREKMIKEYLANTPAWIVQMQRAGFGL